MTSKKITLIGTPGIGKSDIADHLSGVYDLSVQTGLPDETEIAVGPLADYRMEIFLGAGRVVSQTSIPETHTIYTHTLLDSIVYPAARLSFMLHDNIASEEEVLRWTIALNTNMRMLLDSFGTDAVLFLKGNDGDTFNTRLEAGIDAALDELGIVFHVVQDKEEAAKILEEVLDESSGYNSGTIT